MASAFRVLGVLFAVLTIASLGHDIWRSYDTGREFGFSEVGGIFQLYAREQHDVMREAIVDEGGARTFNTFFVPVLSLKTILLTGGLGAIFFLLAFFLDRSRGKEKTPSSQMKYRRR